ncbi:MAG: LysR family transcriptional regulator, partial [Paracoccaceae bacterium]
TADTRDAVYEAVASGIGVGFMWRAGTARTDMVRRITVADIGRAVDEVVFALADDRNEMIDMIFAVASEVSARQVL